MGSYVDLHLLPLLKIYGAYDYTCVICLSYCYKKNNCPTLTQKAIKNLLPGCIAFAKRNTKMVTILTAESIDLGKVSRYENGISILEELLEDRQTTSNSIINILVKNHDKFTWNSKHLDILQKTKSSDYTLQSTPESKK